MTIKELQQSAEGREKVFANAFILFLQHALGMDMEEALDICATYCARVNTLLADNVE